MAAILFHGGRIHVGDGRSAEALLARDGRVVAVGGAADLGRQDARAERIDLRGGLMTPGWMDAHVHFMWWAIQSSQVDLRDARTLEDALRSISERARALPEDAWVLGGRFDKNLWGRWPKASDLDRATGGRPAALRSKDGHSRWLSSRALELAAITAATATPPGGWIERDERGRPTGILKENANALVDKVVPPPSDDECLAAVRWGQREALRRGVTGFETLEQASTFVALQRLLEAGELVMRVAMGIPHASLDAAIAMGIRTGPMQDWTSRTPRDPRGSGPWERSDVPEAAIALGLRTGSGGEWLRIGHLKIFTDGALGSQTAALEEPYAGSDDRGILTIEPKLLGADVARAANAGIAVAIHAIGDRAVRIALDAIEPTRRTAPELRPRVEHGQLVREEDLGRFGGLGVIASMQPIHATSDRDLADRYWPGRTGRAYPWRTLCERGGVLAFGSDAPVEPIDPLLGIHAAVARQRPQDDGPWHPKQALILDEALAAYSAGVAYSFGYEQEVGTLAEGMRCDATVVDRDLAALPPREWLDARVRATVTHGIVRYEEGLA